MGVQTSNGRTDLVFWQAPGSQEDNGSFSDALEPSDLGCDLRDGAFPWKASILQERLTAMERSFTSAREQAVKAGAQSFLPSFFNSDNLVLFPHFLRLEAPASCATCPTSPVLLNSVEIPRNSRPLLGKRRLCLLEAVWRNAQPASWCLSFDRTSRAGLFPIERSLGTVFGEIN